MPNGLQFSTECRYRSIPSIHTQSCTVYVLVVYRVVTMYIPLTEFPISLQQLNMGGAITGPQYVQRNSKQPTSATCPSAERWAESRSLCLRSVSSLSLHSGKLRPSTIIWQRMPTSCPLPRETFSQSRNRSTRSG